MSTKRLSFVSWFIPREARTDAATAGQAWIFAFTHLVGPLLGILICAVLYNADPHPGTQFLFITAGICSFWLLPFGLKFLGRLPVFAFLSFAILTFVTLYGSYYYGGASSPFLPWLLVALLLGFFYLGRHPFLVVGYFGLNLTAFVAVLAVNGGFPERIPAASLAGVGMISVLSATVYVSVMALYYANAVASQAGIEQKARANSAEATRLRRAKEAAERANQEKSVFLAKMSHQLRTPLNAVIGYSEMLLEDAQAEGQAEHISDLGRINSAGKHLLSLVTDVLDMSAIEADRLDIAVSPFDLGMLIDDVVSTARSAVAANGNEFTIERDPELGIVMSDPTRLQQIALNLLGNAAKFTKNGVVTLTVERQKAGMRDWIKISVRDTGIGISPENLRKLFSNFNQAEASTSAKYGGTGLGLALSQRLCHALGGDIGVESLWNAGSCFTIRVPAYIGDEAPSQTDAAGREDFAPVKQSHAA